MMHGAFSWFFLNKRNRQFLLEQRVEDERAIGRPDARWTTATTCWRDAWRLAGFGLSGIGWAIRLPLHSVALHLRFNIHGAALRFFIIHSTPDTALSLLLARLAGLVTRRAALPFLTLRGIRWRLQRTTPTTGRNARGNADSKSQKRELTAIHLYQTPLIECWSNPSRGRRRDLTGANVVF
jgi:hypothetical protein